MDMNSLNNSSDPKTDIVRQFQQEAALNNARQLMSKINENCFEKCVPSPGSSLSKKEEGCLNMCMEKYLGAWTAVSRQYISRIQKSAPVPAGEGGMEGLGI